MPLRHSARRASTDTASAGKKVPTTVTSAEREHRALHDALGTDGDRVGAAHWPPRLRPLVKGGSGSTADIMQPRLPTTSGRSIPFGAAFWAPGEVPRSGAAVAGGITPENRRQVFWQGHYRPRLSALSISADNVSPSLLLTAIRVRKVGFLCPRSMRPIKFR